MIEMNKLTKAFFVAMVACIALGVYIARQVPDAVPQSHAAVRSDAPGWGYTNAVNVLDGGTKLLTCHTASNAFSVYNGGPNPIFLGFDPSVTTDSGYPIASGGQLAIDMFCNADKSGSGSVYATVGEGTNVAVQAAPANTRIIEVK